MTNPNQMREVLLIVFVLRTAVLQASKVCLFVLRFYGPVNNGVMTSAVSLPNHTFTGQS